MPQSVISEQTTRIPENLAKQGISGQIKEKRNNDKNTIHLPRHSSFMILHIFADGGNTGQNMAGSFGITTVSTTKAHGRNRDEGKGLEYYLVVKDDVETL